MSQLRTAHLGGITLYKESVCIAMKSSKNQLFKELNNWFFDYMYANGLPIIQLPPLDDWHQSQEDISYYHLVFPDIEWYVWIRSELLEL